MTRNWTPGPVALAHPNLFSAEEIEAFERELLLNPLATEHDASRFFERLPKFIHFGCGGDVRREVILAGSKQRVDFFRRSYGRRYWDIVELKGPHTQLISGAHTLHSDLSSVFHNAISQALDYRRLIDSNRKLRIDLGRKGIRVWCPQIIVVAGQYGGEVSERRLQELYDRVRQSGAIDPRSYTDIYNFAKEHYAQTRTIVIPALHLETGPIQNPGVIDQPSNEFASAPDLDRLTLSFEDLDMRHPAISQRLSAAHAEAVSAYLDRHHASPVEFLIERGDTLIRAKIKWKPADERTRRTWTDERAAAEAAAHGLALAAIEASYNLVATHRMQKLSGADYFLRHPNNSSNDLSDMVRLDVSAVVQGGRGAVERRLRLKTEQQRRYASVSPTIACVVGLSARRIALRDMRSASRP